MTAYAGGESLGTLGGVSLLALQLVGGALDELLGDSEASRLNRTCRICPPHRGRPRFVGLHPAQLALGSAVWLQLHLQTSGPTSGLDAPSKQSCLVDPTTMQLPRTSQTHNNSLSRRGSR